MKSAKLNVIHRQVMNNIKRLNRSLEVEGIVPDFSLAPEIITKNEHPILGRFTTEVFTRKGIE